MEDGTTESDRTARSDGGGEAKAGVPLTNPM
jgi:hypothetical protein